MVGKTLPDGDAKNKREGKNLLLREEKPLRIEPKEVKPVPKDISTTAESDKPTAVVPKEAGEKKEDKAISPPGLAGAN